MGVGLEVLLEPDLIEPLIIERREARCQAPESLDELELSSNDVDDEAKLCLPGEFESFLGLALHVVKGIANCEMNCDQTVQGINRYLRSPVSCAMVKERCNNPRLARKCFDQRLTK